MSKHYSSRDLPSHTKLKTRAEGQGTVTEHRDKDFRSELEDRERVALRARQKERARKEGKALVSSSYHMVMVHGVPLHHHHILWKKLKQFIF